LQARGSQIFWGKTTIHPLLGVSLFFGLLPCRTVLLLFLIVACDGVPVVENPISTLLNAQKRFQEFVAKLQARGICTLAKIEHVCFLEGGSNYEELWESSLPPRRCHWSPSTFKVRGKHSFFMELTLFVINNLFHRFPHDFLRIAHCPCSHILICIVDRNLRSLQASSMAQTFWASLLEEDAALEYIPCHFIFGPWPHSEKEAQVPGENSSSIPRWIR
jgi:hypothetical protein